MYRKYFLGGEGVDFSREKIMRAVILGIPGIGSQRLRHLIAIAGSAEKAWIMEPQAFGTFGESEWVKDFIRMRRRVDPVIMAERLRKEGISLVMLGEDLYPYLLAECADAPPLLFYKGTLTPKVEGLAVVGSRRATPYGKAAAQYVARAIVENNYVVISGLARGIDTWAHKGALEAGGKTWAFLAGGLDNIYPPENRELACIIMQNGALISEYPPGFPPEAGQFPARNRLISGSSRGVIVVEAAQRSGALITVDFALEQGREVFAVPGPIFSEQSRGTHQLLKMGAKLVSDKEDIFCELPCATSQNSIVAKDSKPGVSLKMDSPPSTGSGEEDDWDEIMEYLSDVPIHIDRLTTLCSLPPEAIALGLLELQLSGKIIQLPGQNFVLQR